MTHRYSWRMCALASAVALLGSLAIHPAYALGLGRITVQSSLGETLRAEIDVPEISAEEAANLRIGVAAPAAFKAAGLEYTVAVVGIQITLQKRADGRSYLSLTSFRPVTEPFVDLILEANWTSGRVVRDYTMLFDPPNLRQGAASSAPVAPTAPVFSRSVPTPGTAATPSLPPAVPPGTSANTAPIRSAPVTKTAPAAPKVTIPISSQRPTANGQQVTVRRGDTAGKIASQSKSASISLDQMLVAMLKSNPDAFIGGNINRLRSGAVLDIPSAEIAGALPSNEATNMIVAQSKDFNNFRQKLAASVPGAQVENANRQAGGKVQAKVEDRAPTASTPDKLTLSKGALQDKAVAEDKIAKDKQAKDASTRVAELAKNIGELNKINGVSSTASVAATSVTAAAKLPGLTVPAIPAMSQSIATPQLAASNAATALQPSASTLVSSASTTATSTSPALASTSPSLIASATATTATPATVAASAGTTSTTEASALTASAPVAVKKPVVATPPPSEPSLIDELTENPLVLPGLGILLALLAGFGFYRYKKRDSSVSVDSSFLESRLQPDSFFGASGGQRIDTSEGGSATGSSMVYSPSQLDAAGDVDPVAEADVYLAYGRDLQAEEILKEALRTTPSRVAIHAKLMEIYAKRRDLKAFEVIAAEAFSITSGSGPEWAYICEMGRDLDPGNTMYQPGGEPQPVQKADSGKVPVMTAAFGDATMPQMLATSPATTADAGVDFDLDLDFSVDDAPSPVTGAVTLPAPTSTTVPIYSVEAAAADPVFDGLNMDFSADAAAFITPAFTVSTPTVSDNSLSFSVDSTPMISQPAQALTVPVADSGMLEFDLGSLSLDLDGPVTESPSMTNAATTTAPIQGPLETKFALAEEFRALGDSDGARSLASEVVAQAQGSLKTKAQAFLSALS